MRIHRHRPNITLTLSRAALETLDERGGPRRRAASVEALLAALRAGEVPTFEPRLADVLAERTAEAAGRARAVGPGPGRPRKKST